MCRWLAYTGSTIPLEALLFNARHSLIDQSMSSASSDAPTNGDGFGVGWYGRQGARHTLRGGPEGASPDGRGWTLWEAPATRNRKPCRAP